MPLILRVLNLNCWALPLPWPFRSRDRTLRIKKIGEALLQNEYDIVALEEVWGEGDFIRLQEALKETYAYSYYFHSGFTGSGICVFSRHPIVSVLMHRFPLNGFAHHIHRGDWFGGKGVCLVEIEIGLYRINFYVSHLHAEYNPDKDLYLPHRLAQAFELAQFVKHTSCSADASILVGDLNIEPDNLAYELIIKNANLNDAWIQKPNSCDDSGATFERPDNCYTHQRLRNKNKCGKRLDYIMYSSGKKVKRKLAYGSLPLRIYAVFRQPIAHLHLEGEIELKLCEISMNRIHDHKAINYSDHAGLSAEFFLSERCSKITRNPSLTTPALLKKVIETQQERMTRVVRDRFIFLLLVGVLVGLILATFFADQHIPGVKTATLLFRFFLTLLIGFCLWYGFIGLTLEYKALKASKASVSMLLNE